MGNLVGHTNKVSAVCFNKHDGMADVSKAKEIEKD